MATTKKKSTNKKLPVPLQLVPVRLCEVCGGLVTGQRKRFCCAACKHKAAASDKSWANHKTEYKKAYATTKLSQYLDQCREANEPKMYQLGRRVQVVERARVPTKKGYAFFIGKHPNTLEKWATDHPEMAVALDMLMAAQEEALISNGLSGRYNPVVTKLMLMNNHNYKEKSEVQGKHVLFAMVKQAHDMADEIMEAEITNRVHDGTASKQ